MVPVEQLQRSTTVVGESVHRKTITRSLHKSGFDERVARRRPFLKESNKKCCLQFATSRAVDTVHKGAPVMKPKFNFLVFMENSVCGRKPITPHKSSPLCDVVVAVGMVFSDGDKEAGQSWWKDGWTSMQDNSVSNYVAENSNRCRTMIRNKKPHCAVLGQSIFMCWYGKVKIQTSILLKICGKTWNCCSDALSPIWLNWSNFAKKKG